MKAPRLFLLGSTLTALAVVRSAREEFDCVVLDDRAGPAAFSRCASFKALASSEEGAVCAALSDLRQSPYDVVIADSDRWLRFVARHRGAIESAGIVVLHPSAQTIELCLSKSAFLRWCRSQALPAPEVYDTTDPDVVDRVKLPVILRPEQTLHSSSLSLPKAIEVRNRTELRTWLARYATSNTTPSLSHSLLRKGLRQFSVGAARDLRGTTTTFLAEKMRPVARQCAGGTYVRSAAHPDIEDLARRAIERLDYFGLCEVEVLHDPNHGESFLIEINARPWLQFELAAACGCDLLAHALGRRARASPRYRDRSWISLWADARICLSPEDGLVRTGEVSLQNYIRSVLTADVRPLWRWSDPWPALESFAATTRAVLYRMSRG
jgi:predicted ATP-grasp superfamily ATP-dependent carboligase